MSRTLSKILVICALVVVIPLMIVGTAFASFYSIDASINVQVYTGEVENEKAFAHVQYKTKANTSLEITAGHLKEIKIQTNSVGYDFIGWYAGTVEEYKADSEAEFVSEETSIKVGMTEYENLVAVFELKTYTVTGWNYLETPDATATTIAPVGSKTEYVWGEALPTFEYDTYKFRGWQVAGDETYYTEARFETSGNVSLDATTAWIQNEQVEVTYYDEEENALASETIYKGEEYSVKDIQTVVSTAIPGYTYTWVNADGVAFEDVVDVNEEFEGNELNIYLKKEIVTYTATVAQNEDGQFTEETTLNFTVEDYSALEALFDADNYATKYAFHTFEDVSYNGHNYTTAESLKSVISNDNPYETASVEVSFNIKKNFTTFTVNAISLVEGTSGDAVYQQGEVGEYTLPGTHTKDSSLTLADLFDISSKTLVNFDEEVVELVSINVTIDGHSFEIPSVTKATTLNDVIEAVYNKGYITEGSVCELDAIIARFAVAQ